MVREGPRPLNPAFPQSISGSDWLNTVAAGDITGELVAAVLPDLAVNPRNVKRSSDRRFVRGGRVSDTHGAPFVPCPYGSTSSLSPTPTLPCCGAGQAPGPPAPLSPLCGSSGTPCPALSPISPTAGLQSRPAALQPHGAGRCRAGAAQDQALQRDGHQELHQVSGHRPGRRAGTGGPEQGQDRGSNAGCCGVGVGAVGWSQSGGSAAGDCGAVAGRVGATEAGDTTQMLEQPPALVELRLAALRAGDGLRCHPASAETLTSLGSPRAGSPTHGAVGVTAVGWSWGVSTPPVPDQAVPKAPGGGSQDWVQAAWGQRGTDWALPCCSRTAQGPALLTFAVGDPEGDMRPPGKQHPPAPWCRCHGAGAARAAVRAALLPRARSHGGAAAPQRSFRNLPSREPMRRMHRQEGMAELNLDRLQLESLHKVRAACPRSPG